MSYFSYICALFLSCACSAIIRLDVKLKQIVLFSSLTLVLAFFCQCGHRDADGYGQEYPLEAEAYAAIDSCMAYMDSDPQRAHRMLDSVHEAGVMSRQRCQYLHAMVAFEGENRQDSALMMCNHLLDEGDFGDDRLLEAEICELASNICYGCNRYIEVLEYADRGIALCHGLEQMRSDEAAMMGRAGAAHQQLGHLDEARQTYDRALGLLREDTSFGGLIALISLQKKQVGLYREAGDYDRMIETCRAMLERVERFDRDPSTVDPRPTTMTTSGEATHDFADFYQTQIYARLATAYRLKVEQGATADPRADRDSAKAYVDKWLQTSGSQSPRNMLYALRELYFVGRRAEFEASKLVAAEAFGSDTLVFDYIEYLRLMAEDAASRNDMQASAGYLQRAVVVNDSIRRHELLRTFAEQMSVHMVQEAQLAQLDAEYRLSRNWIVIAFLIALLLAVVAINVLALVNRRRRRALDAVQHDLEETKEEVIDLEQQLEEVKAERTTVNMTSLYQRIEQAMSAKKLYLDPDLDIKTLAEEVGSSRTSISACINSITGKTFRNWLSEYRLELFVQMLMANPETPIEELTIQCGYKEQSTFRRQFKAAYGMTATNYRKQQQIQ